MQNNKYSKCLGMEKGGMYFQNISRTKITVSLVCQYIFENFLKNGVLSWKTVRQLDLLSQKHAPGLLDLFLLSAGIICNRA